MSTGMCWYLRVESSPTFYYVEVLSTHQYQMCLCTFGSLYGSRAPPHASRGWERMRVGRGRMNSGKIWIRIFQSTMHPSIHVFIHPIHRHFHSKWFVLPRSPAAAQGSRANPLECREVWLPTIRPMVSHRRPGSPRLHQTLTMETDSELRVFIAALCCTPTSQTSS